MFKTVYPVPVEEETEDAGRVFDFLFRNVQEVSPPSDLNLNDPNLIRQQQQDQQGGVYYKPVEQVSQLLLDKVFFKMGQSRPVTFVSSICNCTIAR